MMPLSHRSRTRAFLCLYLSSLILSDNTETTFLLHLQHFLAVSLVLCL